MRPTNSNSPRIAFDCFEVDLAAGQLLKYGRRVRLQPQPFQLLELMLNHPGEVVTREEICRALWASDTFVDFDHSLGTAIGKIREALGDSAERPRFVETLPRRGYRFIGTINPPVQEISPAAAEISRGTHEQPLETPAPVQLPNTNRRTWARIAAGALTLASCSVILVLAYQQMSPRVDASAMSPVPFTDYPGFEWCPTFSPDGSQIAFAWRSQPESTSPSTDLYVRAIGSENLVRLTHNPAQALCPAWSPDGSQIAFIRDTGIYLVPALGGPEKTLLSVHAPDKISGPISWSSDSKWVAYGGAWLPARHQGIHLLSVETLQSKELPHVPGCLGESTPVFSHSGNQLAFLCFQTMSDFEFCLYVTSLSGGPPKLVSKFGTGWNFPIGMAWTADDKRLVLSRPESGDDFGLEEITIADGSVRKLPLGQNPMYPSISAKGDKLAYTVRSRHFDIWRKDLLHPESLPSKLVASTYDQSNPQYSPDGKHIAFGSDRGGAWEIWMSDPDGTRLVRLSDSHSAKAGAARWSPDSQKLVFDSRQSGHPEVYVVDISERLPRKLSTNFPDMFAPSWSHDGKWIYFESSSDERIFRCPATGGNATAVSADSGSFPLESFDGDKVFFVSPASGRALHMAPLKQPGSSAPVDGMPRLDDRSHYTVVPTGIYFVTEADAKSVQFFDFATSNVRTIFSPDKEHMNGLSVSPDGHWILYTQVGSENADIMLVNHFR
jgi:Tol biopolymer transport system component/DNA-binding winged helix-turn-helix (wHTH) protein